MCESHDSSRWEGDGTCVCCEAEDILRQRNAARDELIDTIQALEAAVKALEKYGIHGNDCPAWPQFTSHFRQAVKVGDCTCGFAQALAAAKAGTCDE
jgi:hypothetical protein